jgi:hypothetical protein
VQVSPETVSRLSFTDPGKDRRWESLDADLDTLAAVPGCA